MSVVVTSNGTSKWIRAFAPVWLGQAFSLFGSNLVQFALVWYLTEKTGSTAVLATATLVALLPEVFLGPFAGALVDRWNRRRVMIIADAGIAVATLGLIALFVSGAIQTWHIYAIMFIRSLGGAFHWPAMQASTALMVPEKHLSRIAGANQALSGMIKIGAPPLGALLLSAMTMQSVLVIDVITAGLAIISLLFVVIPQPVRSDQGQPVSAGSIWRDVRAGFRYVTAWPGLFMVILMATVINFLLNPSFSFLPLLVTRHFNGGASQLAWLESAFGVGIVAGGLALGVWGGFKRKIWTCLSGLVGMGAGIAAIGFASPGGYGLALTGMLAAGVMNPLVNGPLFALVQAKVEPEMHGRVFTMISSLVTAISPISLILAAPMVDWLGLQFWYVLGGVVCILMGLTGFLVRAVATMDDQQPGGAMMPTSPVQPAALVSD